MPVLALLVLTCKKPTVEEPEPTPEEKEAILLAENATHNKGLVPDVGNVFFEAATLQTGPARLIAKVMYDRGAMTYYASIDGNRDIESIHAVVFTHEDRNQSVAEIDWEAATFRMYRIVDGNRSNLVLQAQLHAADEQEISLLDVNWGNSEATTIASTYFRDGRSVGNYHAKQMGTAAAAETDNRGSAVCTKPEPTAGIAETIDTFIPYIGCYMDRFSEEALNGLVGQLADLTGYPGAAAAVSLYLTEIRALDLMLEAVAGNFTRFRTTPLATDDPARAFGKISLGTDTVDTAGISLAVVGAESVLEWDDRVDTSVIVLTLQAADKNTGEPFLNTPLFVDARITLATDTGAATLFDGTEATDPGTGRVTFRYNPRQGPVVPKPTDKLTAHYQISILRMDSPGQQLLSVIDNMPGKITIVSGDNQIADWESELAEPLSAKVATKGGRALGNVPVRWSVIGGGRVTYERSVTDVDGIARASYTTGRQIDPHGQVKVEALGTDGQPIPGVEAVFQYRQKKYNFSLLQLKFNDDQFHTGKREVEQEWKDGSSITVHHSQFCLFWVKLDGKIIMDENGKPHEFGFNMENIGLDAGLHPFQSEDIKLPDLAVRFPNPANGATDSVVINLTISNELYRSVVGKTWRLEGSTREAPPGYVENGNAGEVLTFTYRADKKVQVTSLKNPKNNGLYDYEVGLHYGYAPVYDCDAEMTHSMKKVIGVIGAHSGVPSYIVHGSFILFSDYTVAPLTVGNGTQPCLTNIYWKNMTFN